MLKETLLGGEVFDKVKNALTLLRDLEPSEGYYLAFSGGKDSCVIKELAVMAGVKFDAHYNVTTIDPPELVRFIRKFHSDVAWDRPEEHFLKMLVRKGFPQRQRRWCCEEYKERGGDMRMVVTGVRWAESFKRSKRKSVEFCYRNTGKRYLNVIIDWEDSDVWEFIRERKIPYCELYDQGFKRLGCLFCPMVGSMRKVEAQRYPGYVKQFIRAFNLLYANKKRKGLTSVDRWKDGEEMFWWWLSENRESHNPDQGVLFE
jgi:phosphoadenosine phosphosulfate reductase